MIIITGNEPAMPAKTTETHDLGVIDQEIPTFHAGLTIRQHFAEVAMQGLLTFGWNGNFNNQHESTLINELNKSI